MPDEPSNDAMQKRANLLSLIVFIVFVVGAAQAPTVHVSQTVNTGSCDTPPCGAAWERSSENPAESARTVAE